MLYLCIAIAHLPMFVSVIIVTLVNTVAGKFSNLTNNDKIYTTRYLYPQHSTPDFISQLFKSKKV